MSNYELDKGVLIVVSAPSGAGKTSICRKFIEMFPNVRFSVSYTTRSPRPGEVPGRDYNFVTAETFRQMIARGEFIEWVENYGDLYGTSKTQIASFLEKGHDVLLDIESRGAKEVKKLFSGAVFIFVLPPSLSELGRRLAKRGETEKTISRRLEASLDEIREAMWYDYIVVNDDLKDAVERFRAIYIAERSKRGRFEEKIRSFLKQ